ncbi:MAG: PDZ domain-containing protein [Desulfobacteraceae bacterium]|nr:MAG: PDZ domain-containing protein [Desulfobacteraceae bacterium]
MQQPVKPLRLPFLILLFIIIASYIWLKRDAVYEGLEPRPSANSLDFNTPIDEGASRAIIVSQDELINSQVFDKVHQAVVNIAATTLEMNFWMEITPREGQGSGFVIDRKGYILTNNHVVAKAQKIIVTLSSGKKIPAALVGRDPTTDLAVIKVPSSAVTAVAVLGDSEKLRVGQKAIAIGNPFGLSHTLTTGIVSATKRVIRTDDGTQMEELIQTDAAINPGNSGGPLLNSTGEVIGINTAIYSVSGGYQGIGFAIPVNIARLVASQLITSGKILRPWLGISGISLNRGLSEALGLELEKGILVVEVFREGPAHNAGLRGGNREVVDGGFKILAGGDIITAIDETEIQDMASLSRILAQMSPGQKITIRIWRNGKPLSLSALLAERP